MTDDNVIKLPPLAPPTMCDEAKLLAEETFFACVVEADRAKRRLIELNREIRRLTDERDHLTDHGFCALELALSCLKEIKRHD